MFTNANLPDNSFIPLAKVLVSSSTFCDNSLNIYHCNCCIGKISCRVQAYLYFRSMRYEVMEWLVNLLLSCNCPIVAIELSRWFEFFVETQPFLCEDGGQIVKANMSEQNLYSANPAILNNSDCRLVNISDVLVLHWNDIVNPNKESFFYYTLYYVILCYNMLTYFIPFLMLFVLNLLIYIYLKRRRKSLKELGMYVSYFSKHMFSYNSK